MQGLTNEIRIFGPPGCGKTTKLKQLITEEAEERGNTDSIVIASFTKAAAHNLVERKLPVTDEHIGTLHSHAYRMIGQPDLATDSKRVGDFNAAHPHLAIAPDEVDAIENPGEINRTVSDMFPGQDAYVLYGTLRARCTPREGWPMRVRAFAEKWEAFKDMTGWIDYTDMIELALDVPEHPFGARVGFFDEVQDFSALELKLVRQWAERMEVCYLAGDDDQCLYNFRGADADAFLNPPIPQDQKILLSQSYRIPQAVHHFATSYVQTIRPREPKPYLPREEEGSMHWGGFNVYYADMLLRCIDHDLGKAGMKNVMLIGACSYMIEGVLKRLRECGVPFHNPYNQKRWRWNPLARLRKKGSRFMPSAQRVLNFFMPHPEYYGPDAQMWTYHAMHAWVDCIDSKHCAHGAKTELSRCATATPGETVTQEHFDKWFPNEAVQAAMLSGDLAWFGRVLTAKYTRSLDYVLRIAHKRVQALREEPPVIVGTIHSVKGGEADSVYFAPDLSPSGYLDMQSSLSGAMATRRQAYVAMTRAAKKLTVLSPASGRHMPL